MGNRIFADKLHIAVIVVFIKTHNARRQRNSQIVTFLILQNINHFRMLLAEFGRIIDVKIKRRIHVGFFFINDVIFFQQTDLFGLLIFNIRLHRQVVQVITAQALRCAGSAFRHRITVHCPRRFCHHHQRPYPAVAAHLVHISGNQLHFGIAVIRSRFVVDCHPTGQIELIVGNHFGNIVCFPADTVGQICQRYTFGCRTAAVDFCHQRRFAAQAVGQLFKYQTAGKMSFNSIIEL